MVIDEAQLLSGVHIIIDTLGEFELITLVYGFRLLDNAVTTPVLPEVVEKMKEVLSASFGNPSSIHSEGRTAKSLIENGRKSIAKELGFSVAKLYILPVN